MISVIICTFNRAQILRVALDSLAAQTVVSNLWEVIVVDNNSSDDTRKVVEEFINRMENVSYCLEAEQGLSHARNRGWREARGDYVAYVDDDCRIPQEWVDHALSIIEQSAPDAFGGPYTPWYQSPPPKWMKDTYFSTMALGGEARGLGEGEYLSGGNLFVRREILERLGGFDPVLGMQGNEIGTGEETRLQMTMREVLDAPVIIYDPALRVEHLVRAEKMRTWWLLRHRFQSGRYNERIFSSAPELPGGRLGAFVLAGACLTRMVVSVVFGILFRDRRSYPYFKNYFFEIIVNHAQNLGRAWERICSPALRQGR